MKKNYRLVGYDRNTERMADRHLVPDQHVAYARRVAHFSDDPLDIGDAPLNASEAKDIAGTIGVSIDTRTRDYFLELSTVGTVAARKRERA